MVISANKIFTLQPAYLDISASKSPFETPEVIVPCILAALVLLGLFIYLVYDSCKVEKARVMEENRNSVTVRVTVHVAGSVVSIPKGSSLPASFVDYLQRRHGGNIQLYTDSVHTQRFLLSDAVIEDTILFVCL